MILTPEEIKRIILDNPNKELVSTAQQYSKKLRMHMYGEGLKQAITKIDGFESDKLKNLRTLYAKSNKDLFSRLGRPIDKVFSARGGSVYYNLAQQQEKQARQLAMDIRDGYSIRKWVEHFWKPHYLDDPNGIIFIEIDNSNFAYPTYKLTNCIYDYQVAGTTLDYIVFNVDKAEKVKYGIDPDTLVYRVVDDAFDYFVKKVDQEVYVLADLTFPNYFLKVPAILNSDIPNASVPGQQLSVFDDVIELADKFLLTGSIKDTHGFMHGFPKYWEYADGCAKCAGTGYEGADKCTECKGTGKSVMTKVSDIKLLTPPEKDDVVLAPNVAGYVEPSEVYHRISTAEISNLESEMNFTIWGNEGRKQVMNSGLQGGNGKDVVKTATQVVDDYQPMINRLSTITDAAEKRHKFILDMVVEHNINKGYKGSSVNYGRRYMLEGPDVIWQKYSDARKAGSPVSLLDDLYTEYLESKYDSDPVGLAINIKLKDIEPFVHNTIGEVKNFGIDPIELNKKIYFGEWLASMTDAQLLATIDELKQSLTDFVALKKVPEAAPAP